MKKLCSTTTVIALMLCWTVCAFAQETEKAKSPMIDEAMRMCKSMQARMLQMCPMMNKMHKSIVTTTDGGVIVLMGKKIVKYDKDLVLKKEVEIKGGMETMQMTGLCPKCQEMMKNKGKNCPMCGMMMKDAEEEEPIA